MTTSGGDFYDDTDMTAEEFEQRMALGVPAELSPVPQQVFVVLQSGNVGDYTSDRVIPVVPTVAEMASDGRELASL